MRSRLGSSSFDITHYAVILGSERKGNIDLCTASPTTVLRYRSLYRIGPRILMNPDCCMRTMSCPTTSTPTCPAPDKSREKNFTKRSGRHRSATWRLSTVSLVPISPGSVRRWLCLGLPLAIGRRRRSERPFQDLHFPLQSQAISLSGRRTRRSRVP